MKKALPLLPCIAVFLFHSISPISGSCPNDDDAYLSPFYKTVLVNDTIGLSFNCI